MKEREINEILENRRKLVEVLPEKIYKINISEESQKNIDKIRETLTENKNLNFIIYFNHICLVDPWFAGYVANKIDPSGSRDIYAPISYSHTRLENAKSSALKFMQKPAEWCGAETIRVIQAHEVEEGSKDKKDYKPGEIFGNRRNFIKKLYEIRKNERPSGFIISPEGHRSEDGRLGKANNGMLEIADILDNTMFIDITITFDQKFNRGFNLIFKKKVNLEVGESYLYQKGKGEKNIDIYMDKINDKLPEKMKRIEYAQMLEVRENKV